MKDNKEAREELEGLSPFLSELKKQQNFQVPDQYFEQLPDDLMARIKREAAAESTPSASISWLDQLVATLSALMQPRYAMRLASVAVLILAGLFIFRSMPDNEGLEGNGLAALSDDEVHEYISQNIDDYEAEWIPDFDTAENESDLSEEEEAENAELDVYFDEIIDALDDNDLEDLL